MSPQTKSQSDRPVQSSNGNTFTPPPAFRQHLESLMPSSGKDE
ncbi:MAG TPA: hypothetical protein V6C57_26015 [Coleofasciculaceae cyanobacterium]